MEEGSPQLAKIFKENAVCLHRRLVVAKLKFIEAFLTVAVPDICQCSVYLTVPGYLHIR